jgi:UDP-N-acetylglucosamine 2-epimerase (non-hydrolysing)
MMIHTGQHYDVNMSDIFFADLGLPAPNRHLGVGSGTHAQQTGAIMIALEEVLQETQPDLVLVYGDVNSTVAAALVCAKLLVPVAHVEAGLRSFDRTMPEEINRLLTDQIADLLFTPSPDADDNLLREGVAPKRIHRVGNVMIDTLVRLLPVAQRSAVLANLGLTAQAYGVLTLHRPSNVDNDGTLGALIKVLGALSRRLPIVFPVHPRARERVIHCVERDRDNGLQVTEPLGYVDFLRLLNQARLVLTDSGGIQEETTYLGIPCLTLRANTERPLTVAMGTNTLVGQDLELLASRFHAILDGDASWNRRPPGGIPLWDGQAAQRIVAVLVGKAVEPFSPMPYVAGN